MRVFLLSLIAGCGSSMQAVDLPPTGHEGVASPEATPSPDPHAEALEIARQDHDEHHWGYEGDESPDKWGSLDEHYRVCGGGPFQSPIALTSTGTSVHHETLHLEYAPAEFHAVNNGHTIQLNCEHDEDYLQLNGHPYKLIQGHFHAPSEHTVNGEQFPMALHLVHLDEYDHIAVVGIPIRVGAENAVLKPIFDELPAKKGDRIDHPEIKLDLPNLVANEKQFFHYLGSLTTPPCTENVQWLFMESPIEVSQAQLDAFVAVIGKNARPIQPGNQRMITHDEATN